MRFVLIAGEMVSSEFSSLTGVSSMRFVELDDFRRVVFRSEVDEFEVILAVKEG